MDRTLSDIFPDGGAARGARVSVRDVAVTCAGGVTAVHAASCE